MIWLICDSLPFYAHARICSPNYADEELKTIAGRLQNSMS